MKTSNPIKKEIPKEDKQLSLQDSLKVLAEFFNGVVIELED